MAIKVAHGRPSTLISAARRAGEARAAQRVSEQAMAAATRLREKQMEIDYRETLRQQDMAIDLQMNERAKLWEIQKMELRSQVDFQREEQKRLRVLDEYDAVTKHIKDNVGNLYDEDTAEKLLFQVKTKALGYNIPGLAQILFPREEKKGTLSLLGAQPTPGVDDPLGLAIETPVVVPMPEEYLRLERRGKFRVISPDGDEEIINADEWPARKAAGYLLADIVQLRERKPRETLKRFAIGKF